MYELLWHIVFKYEMATAHYMSAKYNSWMQCRYQY
jgi:hypothetical protein